MEITRLLYFLGSSFFIIVGLLHTMVHFKELVSSQNANQIKLAGEIYLMKKKSDVWKLWQGFSLGFGLLMAVVGILNILALYELGRDALPPISICMVNIIVMILVIYMGKNFFDKPQFYGGMLGLLIFSSALFLQFF